MQIDYSCRRYTEARELRTCQRRQGASGSPRATPRRRAHRWAPRCRKRRATLRVFAGDVSSSSPLWVARRSAGIAWAPRGVHGPPLAGDRKWSLCDRTDWVQWPTESCDCANDPRTLGFPDECRLLRDYSHPERSQCGLKVHILHKKGLYTAGGTAQGGRESEWVLWQTHDHWRSDEAKTSLVTPTDNCKW